MVPKVEKIKAIPSKELGEGPHWDEKRQVLYIVDIYNAVIGVYSPNGEHYEEIKLGDEPVGFVVPVKGETDTFVCGVKKDLKLVQWDAKTKKIVRSETLVTVPESHNTRINDGKCDPSGRVWFGTMNDGKTDFVENVGSLYSFTMKEGLKKHQDGITVSNGLAWTKDEKTMFYIDSIKRRVDKYAFDIKSGTMGKPEIAFDMTKVDDLSLPDGMTIDENDNLWVACFRGSQIIHVDPRTGELMDAVKIRTSRQITSACFGGPNLNELLITSANLFFENDPIPTEAGSSFRVTDIGVKGRPAAEFDLKR